MEKTEYPLIMKTDETKLDRSVIITESDEFTEACEKQDEELIYKLLKNNANRIAAERILDLSCSWVKA